ncbi:DUF924 family protein [Niveibacterium sp. SC-1]|uniref:DUF924 family protein n=1 Tax=Niveibacterium sp. SC-1 TaxID=3135646 RepID=UPI00311FFFBC
MSVSPQAVLDFWFLPVDEPGHGQPRELWFRQDASFDAAIRTRFMAAISAALEGGLREWDNAPQGALARILLLDQFTRNVFRGSAAAFSGDALAQEAARALCNAGHDQALPPLQRVFAYLPFEHAEDAAMQGRSVSLFTALAAADAELADFLGYAEQHRDAIARFGRFPGRNAALGRSSSAAELDYLARPNVSS